MQRQARLLLAAGLLSSPPKPRQEHLQGAADKRRQRSGLRGRQLLPSHPRALSRPGKRLCMQARLAFLP